MRYWSTGSTGVWFPNDFWWGEMNLAKRTFWSHLSWLLAFRFWLFHVFPRRLWEHLRSHPNAAVGVRHTSVGIKAQHIRKTSVIAAILVWSCHESLILHGYFQHLLGHRKVYKEKHVKTKIRMFHKQLIDMNQHDSTCMDIGCNIEDVTHCNNINIKKPLGNPRYP